MIRRLNPFVSAMLVLLALVAFWLFSVASMHKDKYDYLVSGDQTMIATIRNVQYWGTPFRVIEVWETVSGERIYREIRRDGKSHIRFEDRRLRIEHANGIEVDFISLGEKRPVKALPLESHEHFDGLTVRYDQGDTNIMRVVRDDTEVVLAESIRYPPTLFKGGFSILSLNKDFSGKLRVYDSETGDETGAVHFPKVFTRPRYLSSHQVAICRVHKDNSLMLFGLDGTKRRIFRESVYLWPYWKGLAIFAALAWWCVWIFCRWNTTVFVKAIVGVSAMNLLAFVFMHGLSIAKPDGSGLSEHNMSAIGVLVSALAVLCMVVPLSRQLRFSRLAFAGITILTVHQASRMLCDGIKLGFPNLLMLQVSSQLLLVCLVRRFGIRVSRGEQPNEMPVMKWKLSIGDLLFLTLFVACVIVMWSAATQEGTPKIRTIWGIELTLMTMIVMGIMLSLPKVSSILDAIKKLSPHLAIGFVVFFCGSYCLEFLIYNNAYYHQINTAGVVMVAASGLLLRCHGYRIQSPHRGNAAVVRPLSQ